MGFVGVITYTLSAEEGASLRACGWWPEVMPPGEALWTRPSRPREKTKGLGQKVRWLWLTGVGQ
jgi:hypothetical protein